MEEWKELPLSQLKKLVKSRAGRVAELRMEIKVLEGLIEARARSGNFGEPVKEEKAPRNEKEPGPVPKPQVQERIQPAPEPVHGSQHYQQSRPTSPAHEPLRSDRPAPAHPGQFMVRKPSTETSSDAPQVYGSQENEEGEKAEDSEKRKKGVSTFVEL